MPASRTARRANVARGHTRSRAAVHALPLAPAAGLAACGTTGRLARYDVAVLARVPDPPDLPEGIAVAAGGTVYLATNPGGSQPGARTGQPSQVFAYSAADALGRPYPVAGQDLSRTALPQPSYRLQAAALDAVGRLYVAGKAPAGAERARVGARTTGRNGTAVPSGGPASVAFLSEQALVTNQAVETRRSASSAVLGVSAGEGGLPPFRKSLAKQLAPRGVRVNAVTPGLYWPPLQPSGGQ